jgi:hypothetical protein
LLAAPLAAPAQSLSPPRAEYRERASGMLTLRNNSNQPMVAIVEARGFELDSNGELLFTSLDPRIRVEFGASSFVLPPRSAHYVFYKAQSSRLPTWFALVSSLTPLRPVRGKLRVNVVLPHFVYLSQKQKLRPGDLQVRVQPGGQPGQYEVHVLNLSEKMGRMQIVQARGFEKNSSAGGFPIFPGQSRLLTLNAGRPASRAEFRFKIQGGKSFKVAVPRVVAIDAIPEGAR